MDKAAITCCSDAEDDFSGYISIQNKLYGRSSLQEIFSHHYDQEDIEWEEDIKFGFHQPLYGNVVCRNGPICLYVAHKKGSDHQWSYHYCQSEQCIKQEQSERIPHAIDMILPSEEILAPEVYMVVHAVQPNDNQSFEIKKQNSLSSSSTSCSEHGEITHDHQRFNKEHDELYSDIEIDTDQDRGEVNPREPRMDFIDLGQEFNHFHIDQQTETLADVQPVKNVNRRSSSCSKSDHSENYETMDSLKRDSEKGDKEKNIPDINEDGIHLQADQSTNQLLESSLKLTVLEEKSANAKKKSKKLSTWKKITKKIKPTAKHKTEEEHSSNTFQSAVSLRSNASEKSDKATVISSSKSANSDTKKTHKWFKLPKIKAKKDTKLNKAITTISISSLSQTSCSEDYRYSEEDADKELENKKKKEKKKKKKKEKKEKKPKGRSVEEKEKSSVPSASSNPSDIITKTTIRRPPLPELRLNGQVFTERTSRSSSESDKDGIGEFGDIIKLSYLDNLLDDHHEKEEEEEELVVKEDEIRCYTMPTRTRDFSFDPIIEYSYKSLDRNSIVVERPVSELVDLKSVTTQHPIDEIISEDLADKFLISTDVITTRNGFKDRSTQADIIYLSYDSWRVNGTKSLPARLTKNFCSFSFEPYLEYNNSSYCRTLPIMGYPLYPTEEREKLTEKDCGSSIDSSESSTTESTKSSTPSHSESDYDSNEETNKIDTTDVNFEVLPENTVESKENSSSGHSSFTAPEEEEKEKYSASEMITLEVPSLSTLPKNSGDQVDLTYLDNLLDEHDVEVSLLNRINEEENDEMSG